MRISIFNFIKSASIFVLYCFSSVNLFSSGRNVLFFQQRTSVGIPLSWSTLSEGMFIPAQTSLSCSSWQNLNHILSFFSSSTPPLYFLSYNNFHACPPFISIKISLILKSCDVSLISCLLRILPALLVLILSRL